MRRLWILSGFAAFASIAALVVSIFALAIYGYHEHKDDFDDESIHLVDRGEFTAGMVLDAVERYEKEGRDATVAYYNTPESTEGEWYVFIVDEADKVIAHANSDLLGEDVKGDIGVDSTDYRFGPSLLDASARGHWVDYLFTNPATGNIEYKHTWVVRHDGLIFGSGWYQVLPKIQ